MPPSTSISALYFEFRPVAGHLPGCPHAGTDRWEATRYTSRGFDGEARETTLRLACHACGAVTLETFDEPPSSFEGTHAREIGYASRPERVAGMWLHPGPRIWRGDDRGPVAYYVTETRDRPRTPADTAGIVGWHAGPRGGVRWSAGTGVTSHGTVNATAGQHWPSRRAAVAWVAAQITPAVAA